MSFNTTLAARLAARLSAWKDPVVLALPSSVTRSGEQTLQSVAVVTGDRVLIETGINAGIWLVQTGAWARSEDCRSTGSLRTGTCVRVTRGTYAGTAYKLETVGAIVLGTTSQTWTVDAGGAFDPLAATVNIATSTTTALNVGSATCTTTEAADAYSMTCVNDWIIACGGCDITSTGAVDVTGTATRLRGSTGLCLAAESASPTAVAGQILMRCEHGIDALVSDVGDISLVAAAGAATLEAQGGGTASLIGDVVTVTSAGDLDITGTTPSMTGSTSSHVLGPTCVVGVSATGVRVEIDSDAGKSRARLYDGSNVLGLSLRTDGAAAYVEGVGATTLSGLTLVVTDDDGTVMTADGAGACTFGGSGKTPTVTGGTVTCGGTTATNLGTSAGNTVTLSTTTSTLSVNAATYNTACTTFSTYAIGTMTLQAYGASLNLQCNSYLMNQGPVAGTARIQDRYPVAVTPGSAAATPIGTVTVPASSSGEWYGTIDLRNGSTNHEVYDVWFLWNSDGTTVTSRDLTVTVKGTTQGTIGTVVGDVTKGDAGLVVTISVANASGFKCALTGRGRFNS